MTGDDAKWRSAGRAPLSSLDQTLACIPATLQERIYARVYLLEPLLIACLAVFWTISGGIGFWRLDAAASILIDAGAGGALANATVIAGSLADIALGLLVLIRQFARRACLGMIALTAFYVFGAAVFAPELWADPLGPMVKTIPAAMLALVAWAVLEER